MAPLRTSARTVRDDAAMTISSYYLQKGEGVGPGYGGGTAERVFTQFDGLREKPSALVTTASVVDYQYGGASPNLHRPSPPQLNVKSSAGVGRAISSTPTKGGATRQPPFSSSNDVEGDRSDVRRALSESWRLAKGGARRPDSAQISKQTTGAAAAAAAAEGAIASQRMQVTATTAATTAATHEILSTNNLAHRDHTSKKHHNVRQAPDFRAMIVGRQASVMSCRPPSTATSLREYSKGAHAAAAFPSTSSASFSSATGNKNNVKASNVHAARLAAANVPSMQAAAPASADDARRLKLRQDSLARIREKRERAEAATATAEEEKEQATLATIPYEAGSEAQERERMQRCNGGAAAQAMPAAETRERGGGGAAAAAAAARGARIAGATSGGGGGDGGGGELSVGGGGRGGADGGGVRFGGGITGVRALQYQSKYFHTNLASFSSSSSAGAGAAAGAGASGRRALASASGTRGEVSGAGRVARGSGVGVDVYVYKKPTASSAPPTGGGAGVGGGSGGGVRQEEDADVPVVEPRLRGHSARSASTSSSSTSSSHRTSPGVWGGEAVASGPGTGTGTGPGSRAPSPALAGRNVNVPKPGRVNKAKSTRGATFAEPQLPQQPQPQEEQLPAAFRRLHPPPEPAYMRREPCGGAGDEAAGGTSLARHSAVVAGGERSARSSSVARHGHGRETGDASSATASGAPPPAELLMRAWECFEVGDAAFGVWETEADDDGDDHHDEADDDDDDGDGEDEETEEQVSKGEEEGEEPSSSAGRRRGGVGALPIPEWRPRTGRGGRKGGEDGVAGADENCGGERLNDHSQRRAARRVDHSTDRE